MLCSIDFIAFLFLLGLAIILSCFAPPGLLAAVGSPETTVNNSTILLTWDPPFTLDMRDVFPHDITYCVEVVSSSATTLHSQCNITRAEFTYPLPPRSWCLGYNFIITPVNVVGDGPSSTVPFTLATSGLQDRVGMPCSSN